MTLEQRTIQGSKKTFRLTGIASLLVLIAGVQLVQSQSTSTTSDKADQNLKSSVRVNPVTLAMEFSLPIFNFPGRNGNSKPVALNYSSKVWTTEKVNFRWESEQTNNPEYDYIIHQSTDVGGFYGKKSAAGWTSSLQSPVIMGGGVDFYNQFGDLLDSALATNLSNPPSSLDDGEFCIFLEHPTVVPLCESGYGIATGYYCCQDLPEIGDYCWLDESTVSVQCIPPSPTPTPTPEQPTPPEEITHLVERFQIQTPDGSSHEFRRNDRFYDCSVDTSECGAPTINGTYLSVDGSRMRLEKGQSIDGVTKDVLYLPDGSRFIFPTPSSQTLYTGIAEKFIDANGNISTYSLGNHSWTDTLGRTVQDPLPNPLEFGAPVTGSSQYDIKGIGGVSNVPYTISWSQLTDVFEDPNNAHAKFVGQDTCANVLPNPVIGDYLFANQPDDGNTEETLNRAHYIRKTRMCVSPYSIGNQTLFNPTVMSEVTLSDGQKYRFRYNEYGEITKIIYPTGGYERFVYDAVAPLGTVVPEVYAQGNRGVVDHFISYDGVTEQHWHYSSGGDRTIVTAPDQSTTETIYWYSSGSSFGFEEPRAGMPKEVRVKDANGVYLSRTFTDWVVTPAEGTSAFSLATRDPRPTRTVSITFENGKALATKSETDYETLNSNNSDLGYFARLNPVLQKKYDYVSKTATEASAEGLTWSDLDQWFQNTPLIAATQTDYAYDSGYRDHGIPSLPIRSLVKNPVNLAWPALSTTETIYDNALPAEGDPDYMYSMQSYGIGNSYDCSSNPQDPKICWQNPNGSGGNINLSYRGLPTTSRVWYAEGANGNGTWIKSHTRYDQFGNPVARTVPSANGSSNESTMAYDPQFKYAYATSATAPAPDPTGTHGTSQTSASSTTFDFTTGLPLSVTDDFGQVTTTDYDAALRPIRVNPVVVNGSPTGPKTETIYGQPDANGQLDSYNRFVKVRKQLDENNWDESTTWFDGLGRTIRTQAKDSQGDVFVDTHYDPVTGRVDRVSSPYRAEDTVFWSKTRYDSAGRAVETYAPATEEDLSTAQSLGVTSFDLSTSGDVGTVIVTTDASGRKSRSITNALGQLIRVDEPTAFGGTETQDLGSSATPTQATYYTYDVRGKMVMVTQGVQKRFFKYDSLGRLIRVNQPEQDFNNYLSMSDDYNTTWHWTAGFTYDIVGNVLTATDANGVTITNAYDNANRVTTRSYSGEPAGQTTPTVNFFYDGKGLENPQQDPYNYAKGKLTKVTSSVSETRYKVFDNFGRLKEMEQRTPIGDQTVADATAYISKYTYNFSGALIEEEYPSGRKVKNEFESDGDLASVTSKKAGGTIYTPYVSNFSYTASGGISQMRLGNGKWETAGFNERLQVTDLGLGASATDTGLWKVHYEYGELSQDGSTVDDTKNTGNIARQTLTVPGTSFVQSYRYDSLYRLTEAVERTGTTQNWIQNWSYDRYGNRNSFIQNIAGVNTATNPSIDQNTNRFNDNQGFVYDHNGNVINDVDPVTSLVRTFVFNGDNKQTEVKNANGDPIGQYFYDGEGKRVKKIVGDETTVFVYSSGKLIAEYSTATEPNPVIDYTTTDHLGSPRIITDQFGQVTSRRDFLPFGEQVDASVGNRSSLGIQYSGSADGIRQKFTGYQKDDETSLDFAEARMYENRFGRFTAADSLLASGESTNPQSFNRYAYVGNNPLLLVDKDGNIWGIDKDNQVRWFAKKLGSGFTEFRPDNWQYKGSQDRLVQLDPNRNRWTFINPVTVDASINPVQTLSENVVQGMHDIRIGSEKGAGNALIGLWNGATDLIINSRNGVYLPCSAAENPLAIERYPYDNDRQRAYGTQVEVGAYIAPGFAGAPFAAESSLSVVPRTYTVTGNRLAGLGAELEYGITGPKRSIQSLTGTAVRRFPDEITETTMTEIKNVAHLNRTNQIMDMHLWAQQEGLRFTIVTRPNTTFSAPMQDLFDSGLIRHQVYNFRSQP